MAPRVPPTSTVWSRLKDTLADFFDPALHPWKERGIFRHTVWPDRDIPLHPIRSLGLWNNWRDGHPGAVPLMKWIGTRALTWAVYASMFTHAAFSGQISLWPFGPWPHRPTRVNMKLYHPTPKVPKHAPSQAASAPPAPSVSPSAMPSPSGTTIVSVCNPSSKGIKAVLGQEVFFPISVGDQSTNYGVCMSLKLLPSKPGAGLTFEVTRRNVVMDKKGRLKTLDGPIPIALSGDREDRGYWWTLLDPEGNLIGADHGLVFASNDNGNGVAGSASVLTSTFTISAKKAPVVLGDMSLQVGPEIRGMAGPILGQREDSVRFQGQASSVTLRVPTSAFIKATAERQPSVGSDGAVAVAAAFQPMAGVSAIGGDGAVGGLPLGVNAL